MHKSGFSRSWLAHSGPNQGEDQGQDCHWTMYGAAGADGSTHTLLKVSEQVKAMRPGSRSDLQHRDGDSQLEKEDGNGSGIKPSLCKGLSPCCQQLVL